MGPSSDKIKVAVVGASGYTGGELLRLLLSHPRFTVVAVTSEKSAGSPVNASFPSLAGLCTLAYEALEPEAIAKKADAVFLALPHTKSFEPVAACLAERKPVVDLSADYRLKDPTAYDTWYQTSHPHPDLLKRAVYGLPECHREALRTASLTASPGCYPTAAILQLAPLVANDLIHVDAIVVDSKSGVSGAGRSPALPYHFPEAHESIEAYKIGTHRHIPEIEQELQALAGTGRGASGGASPTVRVAFTPHLVPMNRGILSTAYGRLHAAFPLNELRALYRDFYKDEPFIRVQDGDTSPNPRHLRGSNFCDVGVFLDRRAGLVVTVAALDNLVKGAAGQAIQAMNLMLGLPETTGLMGAGLFP
jgi:N-acetyl-gamma-glutamyl-phosphate reductase